MPDSRDESFMRSALELAQKGLGRVEPNPMVGCVIARGDALLGSGFHARFGGQHAEVEAIGSCPHPGDLVGATAYVTLEPCCHHGKTPPCTDALIKAGIGRVVVAMRDPFAQVDGGGLKALRDAGVSCEVGLLEEQAESLNAAYLKRVRTGIPWVIAKWAMTADGRIATTAGESQWITGQSARLQVHSLRGRVDAVIVGMGTVTTDDPLLTARPQGLRLATRVVFCRRRLPGLGSKLIASAKSSPVLLIVSNSLDEASLQSAQHQGAEIFRCRSDDRIEMIREGLTELARREMTNVLVEGGGELLASFLEAGQLDECHVFVGAKLFGGAAAPAPIGGTGIERVGDAVALDLISLERFENDLRAIYRRIPRPPINR